MKLPSSSLTRLFLLTAPPLAVALAATAISRAETKLPKWKEGDVLHAADLNDHLTALNQAMVDVSSEQVVTGAKTFTSPSFRLQAEQVQQFISSFHSDPAYQSYLFLERGRGTPAAPLSVVNGDDIGRIYGRAYYDGDMRSAAMIHFSVDGKPSATSVPGAIRFITSDSTTPELERMRITSQGLVGIGTDAPQGSLHVSGTGGWSASNYGTQLIVSTAPNASFPTIGILDQNNAQPWAITNANGELRFSQMPLLGSGAENAQRLTLRADGTVWTSTGELVATSDRRLKRDIRPIEGALDTVRRLQGVSFRWKDAKKDRELGRVEGFIAQDVEQVRPSWVHVGPDGYRELQTVGMNAFLVEAIKEQQRQIELLQRQIRRLEERIENPHNRHATTSHVAAKQY